MYDRQGKHCSTRFSMATSCASLAVCLKSSTLATLAMPGGTPPSSLWLRRSHRHPAPRPIPSSLDKLITLLFPTAQTWPVWKYINWYKTVQHVACCPVVRYNCFRVPTRHVVCSAYLLSRSDATRRMSDKFIVAFRHGMPPIRRIYGHVLTRHTACPAYLSSHSDATCRIPDKFIIVARRCL